MTQTTQSQAGSSVRSANRSASSSNTSTTASAACGCGCGCQGHTPPTGRCCKLTCFERPSYFCGQLLSDADLTLEENYVREKNKLYHRTLDGFGVVCGLRMKCDCQCPGRIIIGDGYAIDCCGNDLVVCEPRGFDVIGELRKKKWLLESPADPCKKEEYRERERDCIVRQCFYIGACYTEEPIDFVTPYTTECSPGPGPCQPTRIREGVRFEIYDELPVRPNPLKEIEKRIERCFRLFREGQFAKALCLLAPRVLGIVCREQRPKNPNERAKPEEFRGDENQVFQELRAVFLHQLRICPDQYNCNLENEVCKVRPPRGDQEGGESTALEAFTKLFELIQKYVFSCVLAEFAFLCPEPPDSCCVLIGAVEIENGRLTRVINYPRWYLWCFANFFEVLAYTLANEAACGKKDDSPTNDVARAEQRCNDGCCPEFEIDLCEFLNLFIADNRAPEYEALSLTKAIQAMYSSIVAGFDFMKPGGTPLGVLNRMPLEQAKVLAANLNFSVESLGAPPSGNQDPLSALLANLIHRGSGPIAAYQEDDRVTRATAIMDAPARAAGVAEMEARIQKLESQIKSLQGQSKGKRGE